MTADLLPPTTARPERASGARAAAFVSVLALLASVLFAPPWAGDPLPAGQVAQLESGALERTAGDRWTAVRVGEFVPVGSRVRALDDQARLSVRDGSLELARGTEATLVDAGFTIRSGRMLVDVDRVVRGTFRQVTAEGRGTWRFDTGVSPRVGVYDGGVGVALAGEAAGTSVGALEQVALIADAPDADGAQPVRYTATDPWDARFLATALAVDEQAARLRTGLEAQYGIQPRTPAFYDDFAVVGTLPASALRELALTVDGDALGPAPDVLLNLVVVDLLARGAALEREAALAEVVTQRRRGASYGLILLAHDLDAGDLVRAFGVALAQRAEEVAAGTAEQGLASGPSPDGTPDGSPTPDPSPSPDPEPSPSPGPSPSPSPDPGVLDPADELVDELPEPVQSPVEDVIELIEDGVDDLPLPDPPGID